MREHSTAKNGYTMEAGKVKSLWKTKEGREF
jgi:hypothetical protein